MTFHIALRIENAVRQETPEEPDWDLDLVALHTCEVLEEINFYEQGVQRIVEITPQGSSSVLLHCRSFGNWSPPSADKAMRTADLEEMLGSLAHTFAEAVAEIYPELFAVSPLPQWLNRK